MEEYKPNSYKYQQEQREKKLVPEKKVESVVRSAAKTKKKSDFRKLADIFIPEDISSVKSYILMDVIIPAIKDGIEDIVHALLRGESGRSSRRSTVSKVSYDTKFKSAGDRRDYNTIHVRNGFDYDDIIFDNRGDAEAVLSAMDDIIDTFGVVSVGDLYDLAEVSTNNYTVNKYGWSDIRGANVIRVRDGYMIKLPKALPLN